MSSERERMAIAEDLGRKISERIEADLQRELTIAQVVLEPPEITIMLMKVCRGVSVAAILVALQARRDETDPSLLFDLVRISLDRMIEATKEQALVALKSLDAGDSEGARAAARRRR